MDRAKLLALVNKIRAAGYSRNTETVLSVEDYFDGNDEPHASVLANAGMAVSSQELRDFLLSIRAKQCVQDVWVRVYEFEDALEFGDAWISSDTVFVATTARGDEVREWFAHLRPSVVREETDLARFNNLPPVSSGFRLIAVWWD